MIDLRKFFFSALIIAFAAMMAACSSKDSSTDDEPPLPEEPAQPLNRTLIVYMEANNNLYTDALADLKEMRDGAAAGGLGEHGRLLVYFSGKDLQPRLIEINSRGVETTRKTYSTAQSSVSIARMKNVLSDARQLAPADEYSIVFWNHGFGWLNQGTPVDQPQSSQSESVAPLSFGIEGTARHTMSLEAMRRALEDYHYEFIYFDCCHMATVEVAYELRNITDRIVASATELGVDGMPYDKNLRHFFKEGGPDLSAAIHETFNYYKAEFDQGAGDGCSISLLNVGCIDDLASATADIFSRGYTLPASYSPVKYFRTLVLPTGIFDMNHYIKALCTDSSLLSKWQATFKAVVVEHLTTSSVYGLKANDFAGLGCHIVTQQADAALYGYTDTQWWADVASQLPL